MTELPEAVRHVRRGTVYRTKGFATLQSHKPLPDGETMVVYVGEDGKMWVRPAAEFFDGRFVVVDLPEEEEPAGHCECCGKPINEGDMAHRGTDTWACEACAPTYRDLLLSHDSFGDPDEVPLTADAAKAIVDKHLAAGGSLDDKIVTTV